MNFQKKSKQPLTPPQNSSISVPSPLPCEQLSSNIHIYISYIIHSRNRLLQGLLFFITDACRKMGFSKYWTHLSLHKLWSKMKKTNWKIAENQLDDWVMACCCLSSTPHNTTYETTLTKRGKPSTISLTQLTAEESESDDIGEKRGGRVETVVFATTQLDMLDRVVVFLTRLVNSNEPRYFKQRFQNMLLWGVAVKFSFVYIAMNTYWRTLHPVNNCARIDNV